MAVVWTPLIERSYLEQKNKIAHSATLTALLVGIIMYPFFLTLDFIVYPEKLSELALIRFATAAIYLVARWVMIRTQRPLGTPYLTVFILFCIGAVSLSLECIVLGGYTSNYYTGLIVLLVLADFFPWSVAQMAVKVSAVFVIYVVMMLAHAGFRIDQPHIFFVNLFVLAAVGVISILFSGIYERLRRQSFQQLIEIEQAKDEISKLLQIRTRFFANVSHELRTPLALILGPARRLLSFQGVSESSRIELKTIERNVQVLLRHVNDLLDAAKGDNGTASLHYQRIELSALIRSSASRFEHLAQERGYRFELALPDSLTGEVDPAQFDRFLTNLLSNAFKFTPRGGTIRVSAQLAQLTQDKEQGATPELILKISDSGPGVPLHLRTQIFERFFQLEESSNRKHGGTGLGLAIAKDCIELHRGAITVGDSPEGGAEFRVVLPLRAPTGVAVEEASGPQEFNPYLDDLADLDQEAFPGTTSHSKAGTLLVVEDNVEMSGFLRRILSPHWNIETAFDGRQALQAALSCRPDVILTDLMMPEVSGEDLLKSVRGHAELADIPVIVLTAKADDQLRSELLQRGAQDFQLKPFSPEELIARIHNWMEVKRSRELLQRELKTQQGSLVQLTEEITEKNAHLQNALRLAEEASLRFQKARTLRDQFIADASHELRTPLTALALQIQLAQMKITEASAKASLQSMSRQIDHLTKLINGMFDLSKIDQGRLTLERSSLGVMSLLQSIIEKNKHYLKGPYETLNLSSDSDPAVQWDPIQMEQVFTNLLINAVKYGSGKPIRFRVEADEKEVSVHFEDQGIGIDPEDQERIFERFERNVSYEKISGLGLGLYISREIVRAHGGVISVNSALGKGSVFSVRMPRSPIQGEFSHE
ncbi:MAG: ATP-binding protein [Bdellovibrionia bacterium]